MYNDEYFLRPIAVKPLHYPGDILFKKFIEGLGVETEKGDNNKIG